jgi:hypothetical protein
MNDADDLEAISAYSRFPGLQSLLIISVVALFLKVLRIKDLNCFCLNKLLCEYYYKTDLYT